MSTLLVTDTRYSKTLLSVENGKLRYVGMYIYLDT